MLFIEFAKEKNGFNVFKKVEVTNFTEKLSEKLEDFFSKSMANKLSKFFYEKISAKMKKFEDGIFTIKYEFFYKLTDDGWKITSMMKDFYHIGYDNEIFDCISQFDEEIVEVVKHIVVSEALDFFSANEAIKKIDMDELESCEQKKCNSFKMYDELENLVQTYFGYNLSKKIFKEILNKMFGVEDSNNMIFGYSNKNHKCYLIDKERVYELREDFLEQVKDLLKHFLLEEDVNEFLKKLKYIIVYSTTENFDYIEGEYGYYNEKSSGLLLRMKLGDTAWQAACPNVTKCNAIIEKTKEIISTWKYSPNSSKPVPISIEDSEYNIELFFDGDLNETKYKIILDGKKFEVAVFYLNSDNLVFSDELDIKMKTSWFVVTK